MISALRRCMVIQQTNLLPITEDRKARHKQGLYQNMLISKDSINTVCNPRMESLSMMTVQYQDLSLGVEDAIARKNSKCLRTF